MATQNGPVLNAGEAISLDRDKASAFAKNKLFGYAAAIAVVGLIVLSQFRAPVEFNLKKGPAKTISIDTEKVDREVFAKNAGDRIQALEVERDQLQRMIEQDHRDKDLIKAQLADMNAQISMMKSKGIMVQAGPAGSAKPGVPGTFPPLPPPMSPVAGTQLPVGGSVVPASLPVVKGPVPSVGPQGQPLANTSAANALQELQGQGIRTLFKIDPAVAKKEPKKTFWLPMGSIIPVRLLSGMDAPARAGQGTGSGSGPSGSPYPVLMVVRDLAKLPNAKELDARECFLLGEGVGELSSERVQIRSTGISCVKDTGEAVELEVKGFINGEDGKLGMRGRVVFKEGGLMGRALLAGFVSGISQAFMPYQQGIVVSSSPSQAFNMPPAGPIAMAGAAGGMGNAARLLAQHYSKMAASIFPIIEIDAQRDVDFVVGTGRELVDYFL